jgi:hypothetical protein
MSDKKSGWRRTFYKLEISNTDYGEYKFEHYDNIVPARKRADELINGYVQKAINGKMTKEVLDHDPQNHYQPVVTLNAIQNVKFVIFRHGKNQSGRSIVFQITLKEFLEKRKIFLDCRWLETQYVTMQEFFAYS